MQARTPGGEAPLPIRATARDVLKPLPLVAFISVKRYGVRRLDVAFITNTAANLEKRNSRQKRKEQFLHKYSIYIIFNL